MPSRWFQPMLMSEDEARERLQLYFPSIKKAIEDGFFEFANLAVIHPPTYAVMKGRTRASLISDWIIQKARYIFAGMDNIEVKEVNSLILFIIDGTIVLRFKKLSSKLRPSHSKTFQQEKFAYNLPLPGVEPATYFTAGYVLDSLGTKVEGIHVVHQEGKNIVYAIQLNEQVAIGEVDATIVTLENASHVLPEYRLFSKKAQQAAQDASQKTDQDVKTSGE